MEDPETQTSPQTHARIGGALYLIIIAGGLFGEAFIRNALIVPGDAAATAEKIRSSELLWRAGVAGEFFYLACTVALALVFYVLLRPVSRDLALLAVFFNLVCVAVEAANEMNLLTTLLPLTHAEYLKAFEPEQLSVLAHLPLRSYAFGFGNSLIFFGCECLVLGYLIFRSGYLPKAVGILMQMTGLCYLTNSFAVILSPSVASGLYPAILIPPFIGEATLCLWLLVKGVDVAKWKTRVGTMTGTTVLSGA